MDGATLALLLSALIAVESGGNASAIGDNGKAIGVLQVHEEVVADVNRIYRYHVLPNGNVVAPTDPQWKNGRPYQHSDMLNPNCARHVSIAYLRYWGKYYEDATGLKATPEILSRIWNGGPNGWKKQSTIVYWQRVKLALRDKEAI